MNAAIRLPALRSRSAVQTALLLAVSVVVVVAIGVLLGWLVTGPLAAWLKHEVDDPVRTFSVDHQSGALTRIAKTVSSLGSSAVTGSVAALVALVWWLRTRNPRPGTFLIATFAGAAVVTLVVKYAVHRAPASGPIPRFSAGTFPSGHVLFAIAAYGTLAVLVVRTTRLRPLRAVLVALLVTLPIVIGLARVYLLDHYLSDVLGSILLGVALIAGAATVIDMPNRAGGGD